MYENMTTDKKTSSCDTFSGSDRPIMLNISNSTPSIRCTLYRSNIFPRWVNFSVLVVYHSSILLFLRWLNVFQLEYLPEVLFLLLLNTLVVFAFACTFCSNNLQFSLFVTIGFSCLWVLFVSSFRRKASNWWLDSALKAIANVQAVETLWKIACILLRTKDGFVKL